MKILNAWWFKTPHGTYIGIVTVENKGKCKSYIGTGLGIDEGTDANEISKYGVLLKKKTIKSILGYLEGKHRRTE